MSHTEHDHDAIRAAVRATYAKAITEPASSGCCGTVTSSTELAKLNRYTDDDVASVPSEAAESSLGCGNPLGLASVRSGDTVLDLGSGAGFDCLLAAKRVGSLGCVIGIDMTPEMVARATANIAKAGAENVQIRLGTMEELPVEDASVDLVISNCVINLSPDKEAVFHEIARVLRPGGRMVVSDIVLTAQIPEDIRGDLALWGSCLGGALQESEYLATIASAGLAEPKVEARTTYGPEMIEDYLSGSSCACSAGSGARFSAVHRAALAGNVHSITVTAHRAVH